MPRIWRPAIHKALQMSPEERSARMARMRAYVREHNIYRWAGSLIAELASLRLATPEKLEAVASAKFENRDATPIGKLEPGSAAAAGCLGDHALSGF